jgi:hypothetical protein
MNQLPVKDVAIALYENKVVEKFGRNNDDANELLRNAILKAAGCENGWNKHKFEHNKHLVFEILTEVLDVTVGRALMDKYNSWVDFRNVALGDTTEFIVPNNDLFEVGLVSRGNDNLIRQRILGNKLQMTGFPMGVKIYEEYLNFVMGKVDFVAMVKRVAESMDNAIMRIIVKQIETAYVGQPNGLYHVQGTYADDKIMELIANVEAKTGQKVAIYGNALALANLRKSSAANWAEADKLDIRNQGYVGKFNGRDAIELPNFMDNNDQLVLSQKHLFIVPNGIKIVKLVNEGQADVYEVTDQHARLDNQIEYMFKCNMQLGVLKANYFGVYQID